MPITDVSSTYSSFFVVSQAKHDTVGDSVIIFFYRHQGFYFDSSLIDHHLQ
jgi:hypothetical protein